MSAGPATAGFIGRWARAEQFTVGFLAAELLEAPGALHGGDGFQWRHERRRHSQRQHQAHQFTAVRFESLQDEAADQAQNRQHRKQDHQLLGTVMQDVFKEEAIAANEAASLCTVEKPGQVHVQ